MKPFVVLVPVQTASESNKREHWRYRHKRSVAQRSAVALLFGPKVAGRKVLPCIVTLTRVSPRCLDDDNLRGALKFVRDQVAQDLGLPTDRDPRVAWLYDQGKGAPNEYAVRIAVVPQGA